MVSIPIQGIRACAIYSGSQASISGVRGPVIISCLGKKNRGLQKEVKRLAVLANIVPKCVLLDSVRNNGYFN